MPCSQIDRVFRIAIMFGIYPSLLGGIVLIGYQQLIAGGLLIGIGTTVVLGTTYMKISYSLGERFREQWRVAGAIGLSDPESGEYQLLLESAFRLFDGDDSGQIDM